MIRDIFTPAKSFILTLLIFLILIIISPQARCEEREWKRWPDLDTALLLTTGFLDAHSTSTVVSPDWRPHPDGGWVRYRERNPITNAIIDPYCPCFGKRLAFSSAKALALDFGLKRLERKGRGWREASKSLRYSLAVLQGIQAIQNYRKAR